MDIDSLFDQALHSADQAINAAMATEFQLILTDGSVLEIHAIFDTQLKPSENEKQAACGIVAEYGAFTILNQRVEKERVIAACVETPLGLRYVADVRYPDNTTSVFILSKKPTSFTVTADDNFL